MMLKKISIISLVALLSVHINVYSAAQPKAFNVPVNSLERHEQCMEAAGLKTTSELDNILSRPVRLNKPLSVTDKKSGVVTVVAAGSFVRFNWDRNTFANVIRVEDKVISDQAISDKAILEGTIVEIQKQQGRFLHRAVDGYYNVQDKTVQWAQTKPKTAVAVGAFTLAVLYGVCIVKGYTKVPGVISLQNFGSFVGQKWANCFANKTSQAAATALGDAALKTAATIAKV